MTKFDLFFSYNRESSSIIVNKLLDQLKKEFKIWIDTTNVYPDAETLDAAIQDGLDNTDVVVCFLTKLYFASSKCMLEIKYATAKSKKCIFVMLEKIPMKDVPQGLAIHIEPKPRFNAYKEQSPLIQWSSSLFDWFVICIRKAIHNAVDYIEYVLTLQTIALV